MKIMSKDDCYKGRDTRRLRNPKFLSSPFFAYDVFKRGEVAYSRIEDYVDEEKSIYGYGADFPLDIVNGVPFLFNVRGRGYHTQGDLLYFKKGMEYEAYEIISDAKSLKLYGWRTYYDGYVKMNVLMGKKDIPIEYHENRGIYRGKDDPMIIRCIYTIWRNVMLILLKEDFDTDDFFNLQMNYIFLWSSIDRYLVLKYGKKDQQENLKLLADEESFKNAVLKYADIHNKKPKVFSNEDYRNFILDKDKPLCCIRYYYTIRCNVVHTGKSSYDDYKLLKYATFELLLIYMQVLRDSFRDGELFRDIFYEIKMMDMF